MDTQRDFEPFKRLVMRLCVTFDKFANEELVESWWKALRDVQFAKVEKAVDAFIANATDKTKFPRPGQFRPNEQPFGDSREAAKEARIAEENTRNWKTFIVRFPKTGPHRLTLARLARILATEHEGSAVHAEALGEYRALETYIGGRFSADA
jgi:hypothetical protein